MWWFLAALFTVVAWAGSDLFTKMGTRPDDKLSQWRVVIAVGTVMGLHAVGYILVTGTHYEIASLYQYLPVSFLYILSMIFGYMGLRYIRLSVSSPICNSSGAVTAVLCFLILKQTMTILQLIAVVCICAGILLLSIFEKKNDQELKAEVLNPENRKYSMSFIALLFPILYCIIDGAGSFMDALVLENYLDEAQANLSYEFTFLILAVIAFIYMKFIKKEKLVPNKDKFFAFGALCETAGQFTYISAMATDAIVAAPMISSYSVVSVLLSRIFLKEKLSKWQYGAILLVMVGIAILGIE